MSARVSKMPALELNNNNSKQFDDAFKRNRNESTASSASSCHSDSSEDTEATKAPPQETEPKENAGAVRQRKKSDFLRLRSMSDGANHRLQNQEPFEVFPSLPDSVLEKMGLLGSGPRERLSDEDLEQKFISLALAFTIDAATIKDRCERQRRYRDQTETNLNVEIERLIQKANRIQPLCVDAETTELLSALLSQIDIVMRASSHATISAERYGAVQHEERISESVNVMINHVNLLKQQRDSARRQLQYTKRVLQNSNVTDTSPTSKQVATVANGKVISKRRASIATIGQPFKLIENGETKVITRRTSDLSLRASLSHKINPRPSRLELGVDLVKIKENTIECESATAAEPKLNQSEPDLRCREGEPKEELDEEEHSSLEECHGEQKDVQPLPLRQRLLRRFRRFRNDVETKYTKWNDNGTLHEIFCFCAIICFSISIITMANILIEIEFAKRGLTPSKFFWFWSSGNSDATTPLTRRIYRGGTSHTS